MTGSSVQPLCRHACAAPKASSNVQSCRTPQRQDSPFSVVILFPPAPANGLLSARQRLLAVSWCPDRRQAQRVQRRRPQPPGGGKSGAGALRPDPRSDTLWQRCQHRRRQHRRGDGVHHRIKGGSCGGKVCQRHRKQTQFLCHGRCTGGAPPWSPARPVPPAAPQAPAPPG